MLEEVKTKLETNDETLKLVAEELIKRCETEPEFIAKILNEKKSLDECWDYIKSEAKKKAIGGAVAISDSEVFGWAIHYFWEENLEWKKPKAKVTTSKTSKTAKKEDPEETPEEDDEDLEEAPVNKPIVTKPAPTKKQKGIAAEQLSLF